MEQKFRPFIIGINGPPQIGKGWLACNIAKILPFNSRVISISEGIREDAMKQDRWSGTYEEYKRYIFMDGLTGRERMIQRATAKRAMEINYYSKIVTDSPKFADPHAPIIILDDLGFQHELVWFGIRAANLMVITIAPPEFNVGAIYPNDSRTCLSQGDGIRAFTSTDAFEQFKIRLANAASYESARLEDRALWFSSLLDRSLVQARFR